MSKRNEAACVVWLKKKNPKTNSCVALLEMSRSERRKYYRTDLVKYYKLQKIIQWNLFLFLPTVKKSDHKQYKDSKLLSRELGMPVTQTTERRKSSNIS